MKKKSKNEIGIMDFINNLSISKKPWEDYTEHEQKKFNPYIVNLWLSMNIDYIETINQLQKYTIGFLEPKIVYKLYLDFFPDSKIYLNYIKSKVKKKYQSEIIDYLIVYFEVSRTEVVDYLDILFNTKEGVEHIKEILSKYGVGEKEQKRIMKIN
ncbi:MAG: hypothetical protein M0R17_09095 [Candidatus Omnitrophica bacterium]|jgi:hypothetical protein|nr:hypothetical protein [Candidatus Omnitrophota bacterium]